MLARVRSLAPTGALCLTLHAHQEMVEEGIALDDVLQPYQTATSLSTIPTTGAGLAASCTALMPITGTSTLCVRRRYPRL